MRLSPVRLVAVVFVAALVVFCAVQDRLTVDGVRVYVDSQRAALTSGSAPVSIDAVMRPAVRHSVRRALFWSGTVMSLGLGGVAVVALRSRRG